MDMSKNLRRRIKEKGLTVAELATRAQVPAKTIYHWTSGQKPRHIDQLLRVCSILEISIEYLFDVEKPIERMTHIRLGEINSDMHLGTFEVVLRPLKK